MDCKSGQSEACRWGPGKGKHGCLMQPSPSPYWHENTGRDRGCEETDYSRESKLSGGVTWCRAGVKEQYSKQPSNAHTGSLLLCLSFAFGFLSGQKAKCKLLQYRTEHSRRYNNNYLLWISFQTPVSSANARKIFNTAWREVCVDIPQDITRNRFFNKKFVWLKILFIYLVGKF